MNQLETVLQDAKRVTLLGHIHPNGDCVGSYLVASNYIRARYEDKQVDACLEPTSKKLAFLSGYDSIYHEIPEEKEYGLCIYLDSNDRERLGEFGVLLDGAKQSIYTDHHITNTRYAMEGAMESFASSTYEAFFGQMDERWVDKPTAECIYTGIVHNTGVFKFSNISAKTMVIAGKMTEGGIDFGRIIDESFFQKNYLQIQILGQVLLENITFSDRRCILSVIGKKDMEFLGVENKDLDGIVDQLRIIEKVECAIFLYETDNHVYKTSLCSNTQVDVSKIASYSGGGGHVRAAGYAISGSIHNVINDLSEHIEKRLT